MTHRLPFLVLLPALALLPRMQGAPAATPAPAASIKVESAGDTLPFTLQGFFGKPGAIEVSLREKTTGATAWVKPGKSFSGWTVESVDTDKGAVVLVADGRHVRLEKAKETRPSEAVAAPRLKSLKESLIFKKFLAMGDHPEVKRFFERAEKEANRRLKAKHPEFYDEQGKPRDRDSVEYVSALLPEMKSLLREDKTPSVVKFAPVYESMMDAHLQARLQAGPPPKYPDGGSDADQDRFREQWTQYVIKEFEAADRIYIERYGKTEPVPVPSQPQENEMPLTDE